MRLGNFDLEAQSKKSAESTKMKAISKVNKNVFSFKKSNFVLVVDLNAKSKQLNFVLHQMEYQIWELQQFCSFKPSKT